MDAKPVWGMTRSEFRAFAEGQGDARDPARRPYSIGDYDLPARIVVEDRVYSFWYASRHRRGTQMSMSNRLYVAGPGLRASKTAAGSMSNADATFFLRNVRRAEVCRALAMGLPVPAEVLREFPKLIEEGAPCR
ncbi:MAG: hypothetical protein IPK79_00060 [Vampirovibrionales bacterium]|nr:hypothetical protein [Vampirovibrionales bacterium]